MYLQSSGAAPPTIQAVNFLVDLQHLCSVKPGKNATSVQWEFQDPKMEVLYHIRPYFAGIFPYIGLKNGPYIW
jgi:hypothetical protein